MHLPGARYQEAGWDRVKSLICDAGLAALSNRSLEAFAAEDPEGGCQDWIDWLASGLSQVARPADRVQSANEIGDPAVSLAYALIVECAAFPRLFVRHSARMRALPPVGQGSRAGRLRTLLGQYFSELRDEVDARGIAAATGQRWTANRLWIYRQTDKTWHDLCAFFAQPLTPETVQLAEQILQRTLQTGAVPIQVARLKRRRTCAPEWIIRWSEAHRGWLHNTKRAEGWHLHPEKIAAVLQDLADGDEMHGPGLQVRTGVGEGDPYGWLVLLGQVLDEEHAPTEEGSPVTNPGMGWDPWSPEALSALEAEDIPDDSDEVEPGLSEGGEPDEPVPPTQAFTPADGKTGATASAGAIPEPLTGLGLPPGYGSAAQGAEDVESEVYAVLASRCSLWVRMQLYKSLIGPADTSYPNEWCLPDSGELPTQAQLAALEGISVPAFTRRVRAAREAVFASALGRGRSKRGVEGKEMR